MYIGEMQVAFQNMLDLQDQMNTKVNPDWKLAKEKFYRAGWVECAELLDHHGYKWWKRQEPDNAQIELEIVDIWHFGLSMLILENLTISTSEIAIDMVTTLEDYLYDKLDPSDTIETLVVDLIITQKFSLLKFWSMMYSFGMTDKILYQRYIGKNVLNIFRQDHGYKTGEYKKIWNGTEDNEVLTEIMSTVDVAGDFFANDVYDMLNIRYKTLD